jgi:hypothetical protein
MARLTGRVAIVTGAGRGIGRSVARLLATEGASVVVNDLGAAVDGSGQDSGPAHDVVAEIGEAGGKAMASDTDIADFTAAENLTKTAIEEFGRLDILVNAAGILRDRMVFNMTEQEWDDVIRVHLKGTFNTTKFASAHWRSLRDSAAQNRIINFTSVSGLHGADDGEGLDEEVDPLEELEQVAVLEHHLAVHDRALRVVALVQRLPVQVVHAEHVGGPERGVRGDDLAVGDRAAAPLHEKVRRAAAELRRQVAAPERPGRRVHALDQFEEVPVLLQLARAGLLRRAGGQRVTDRIGPLLAEEIRLRHGSPTRQDGLHPLQQVLDIGREADADVVQLAPQLLEEQQPHLLLGPAQRLVVDPAADHAG